MAPSWDSLSPQRKRLVREFQRVNFGRFERLAIHAGEPVLNPAPIIVRDIKFAGENGPRPELQVDDFILKAQVVELFGFFDRLQDGVIDSLEVKHGLPFRMLFREAAT